MTETRRADRRLGPAKGLAAAPLGLLFGLEPTNDGPAEEREVIAAVQALAEACAERVVGGFLESPDHLYAQLDLVTEDFDRYAHLAERVQRAQEKLDALTEEGGAMRRGTPENFGFGVLPDQCIRRGLKLYQIAAAVLTRGEADKGLQAFREGWALVSDVAPRLDSIRAVTTEREYPPEMVLAFLRLYRGNVALLCLAHLKTGKRVTSEWVPTVLAKVFEEGAEESLKCAASWCTEAIPTSLLAQEERYDWKPIFERHASRLEHRNELREEARASGLEVYPPLGEALD